MVSATRASHYRHVVRGDSQPPSYPGQKLTNELAAVPLTVTACILSTLQRHGRTRKMVAKSGHVSTWCKTEILTSPHFSTLATGL